MSIGTPTPAASDTSFACKWRGCNKSLPSANELYTHTALEHLLYATTPGPDQAAFGAPATHTAPLFPLTPSTTPSVSPAPAPHESSPAPFEDAPDALEGSHECGWAGCLDSFPTAKALTDHLFLEHIGFWESQYECFWVGCDRNGDKSLSNMGNTRVHMRSHTGYKPFECHVCKKGLSGKAALQNHIRSHTGEKPHPCDHPSCDKSFNTTNQLTQHKRTHSGEKPFECRYKSCDKTFARSGARVTHERKHSGLLPYGCIKCGKRFRLPTTFQRHLNKEHKG